MLPIHPHPKPGEILSSWMVRFAMGNGFKLHTFYAQLLGYKSPIWNRDIDRHPQRELIKILCKATGHSEQLLFSMSLLGYEGILTASAKVAPDNPSWIIPIGVFHRMRKRDGMQFCPLCLASDGATPFFRQQWRIALACICPKHGCMLHGCCPNCEQPVSYHRLDTKISNSVLNRSLSLCWHCNFDLRLSVPSYIDCRNDVAVHWLMTAMNVFAPRQGCKWTHSGLALPFYQGVMVLAKTLSGGKGSRLYTHLRKVLGFEPLLGPVSIEFAKLKIRQRTELLLCVGYLLDEWPERFVALCRTYNLSRSRFSDSFSMMPWWIYDVINTNLDGRIYIPSEEELRGAIAYLKSRSISISIENLKKHAGLRHPFAVEASKNYRLYWSSETLTSR